MSSFWFSTRVSHCWEPSVGILSGMRRHREVDRSDEEIAEVGAAVLKEFRRDLFGALTGWADALFELCDAALCLPAPHSGVDVFASVQPHTSPVLGGNRSCFPERSAL